MASGSLPPLLPPDPLLIHSIVWVLLQKGMTWPIFIIVILMAVATCPSLCMAHIPKHRLCPGESYKLRTWCSSNGIPKHRNKSNKTEKPSKPSIDPAGCLEASPMEHQMASAPSDLTALSLRED